MTPQKLEDIAMAAEKYNGAGRDTVLELVALVRENWAFREERRSLPFVANKLEALANADALALNGVATDRAQVFRAAAMHIRKMR